MLNQVFLRCFVKTAMDAVGKAYAKKFGKGKEEVMQMGSWMTLGMAYVG